MTLYDSYSRDQLRQSYVDAWRKHQSGEVVSPLEAMIADVIGAHPEYQALLQHPDKALLLDPAAVREGQNPFLHMGLHMAIREQISIDRPPGIRALYEQLEAARGGLHDAEHILMDALAETLWEAQQSGRQPDETHYLRLARGHLT